MKLLPFFCGSLYETNNNTFLNIYKILKTNTCSLNISYSKKKKKEK